MNDPCWGKDREVKDPWEASNIDYDRSIHSNRDAKAWADFFVATYPGLADKHDIMLGWFANALESMRSRLCASLGLPADSTPETVAEAVEARRVVVPELTSAIKDSLWDAESHRLSPLDWKPFSLAATATAAWFRDNARAIPADRVLGDGIVGVDQVAFAKLLEEISSQEARLKAAIVSAEIEASRHHIGGYMHRVCTEHESIIRARLYPLRRIKYHALRANQGGADHG